MTNDNNPASAVTTTKDDYRLNGTQLECDCAELQADDSCPKCDRINSRIGILVADVIGWVKADCRKMHNDDYERIIVLESQVASLTAAREQVKAEVVEKAAKIAEAEEAAAKQAAESGEWGVDYIEQSHIYGCRVAAQRIAAAIRALLEEKGDEG